MFARNQLPATRHDPLVWCLGIAAAFFALCLYRFSIPSNPYFDEVHYLPAARKFIELSDIINREHPPLAKYLLALMMHWFGDNPIGWRIGSLLSGTLALYATMRAVWWASLSRMATILVGVLLATNFLLFIQSRIAMLDSYMLGFAMLAVWFGAKAARRGNTIPNLDWSNARGDLAFCGTALGLALACKWSVAPMAVAFGLAFAFVRWREVGWRRVLTARNAAPIRGVSLLEATLWLGVVPLLVFMVTFAPYMLFAQDPLTVGGFTEAIVRMRELQESVAKPHTYQSVWWQWMIDQRPIWYFYEMADNAQRGVIFLGNPVSMLLGLPALGLAAWFGYKERNPAMLGTVMLYAATLGLWIVAAKPVQFYYHYHLPAIFLAAALALVLARWWEHDERKWPTYVVLVGTLGMFNYFYPILSSAPLASDQAFLDYAWFVSWR